MTKIIAPQKSPLWKTYGAPVEVGRPILCKTSRAYNRGYSIRNTSQNEFTPYSVLMVSVLEWAYIDELERIKDVRK